MAAPAIYGCAGTILTEEERAFFADAAPVGFILFARNCESPDQVRALVEDLSAVSPEQPPLILIDQEGGRVQRLGPPHWRAAPPAAVFGAIAAADRALGAEAVEINTRLLAADLADLGINTDCIPLLDLRAAGGHDIIGDRTYSDDIDILTTLAQVTVDALLAGGVLPVVKHLPGHGRATVDSHMALPTVTAGHAELSATDFAAFRPLAEAPLGMTAHVVYAAIDADAPATTSPTVIEKVIRDEIGFGGLLMSDDVSMHALSGDFADRTRQTLVAGCDLVLHCNGDMAEMVAVAAAAGTLSPAARARLDRALGLVGHGDTFDRSGAEARLAEIFATAGVSMPAEGTA